MARELILIKKCDLCQREDDNVDVPATVTYTVGIVQGESRPVPKVLDVCDGHAGPLADLAAVMADIHQLPGDSPPAAKKAAKAAVKAPATDGYGHKHRQCPICHSWRDTVSLTPGTSGGHTGRTRNRRYPPVAPSAARRTAGRA